MKEKEMLHTKQGYSYLKCTKKDCFDWGGLAICDFCGEDMKDDVYLIFILNSALCPKCFEEWISRAKKYSDDIELQKQNHERWYEAYGFKTI